MLLNSDDRRYGGRGGGPGNSAWLWSEHSREGEGRGVPTDLVYNIKYILRSYIVQYILHNIYIYIVHNIQGQIGVCEFLRWST